MKVLHIIKTNTGATWAFNQIKELKSLGVEIVVMLPNDKSGYALKYKEINIEVIQYDPSLPIKRPWEIFDKIKRFKECIKNINPDLIHCHFVTNIFFTRIALRTSNIPRIFQVPGPLHLENKFFRWLDVFLSKENDYWIPTCKKSYNIYKSQGISDKRNYLVYYGGYGGKVINEYEDSTNILHNQYNLKEDDIIVGMVSYFYKPKWYLLQTRGLKGHEDFIDAIKLLREENFNIKGIIVGGPWGNSEKYENKIKKYAFEKCKDNIIFTGFRDDIKKIYKEFDIAVHPSHSENLGGAAESLAAGVPTVACDVGGFPDIIINNETGYLCRVKNPDSLKVIIEKILNNYDSANIMAQKGKKLVENLLDIKNTASNVRDVYVKILNVE